MPFTSRIPVTIPDNLAKQPLNYIYINFLPDNSNQHLRNVTRRESNRPLRTLDNHARQSLDSA
jgi:hypothetical protein